MLPKNRRLTRTQIPELAKSRSVFRSKHFTLRFVGTGQTAKAAVSVSKKVAKKAVSRNRLRRRTYATLRDLLRSPGLYLFVAGPDSAELRGETLREEVVQLLKSAERSYNSK